MGTGINKNLNTLSIWKNKKCEYCGRIDVKNCRKTIKNKKRK